VRAKAGRKAVSNSTTPRRSPAIAGGQIGDDICGFQVDADDPLSGGPQPYGRFEAHSG
jgi:hypothetical protein